MMGDTSLDHGRRSPRVSFHPWHPPAPSGGTKDSPVAHFPWSGIGALRALSIHHRNAPLPLLERVALSPAQREALYAHLHADGIEAVALSTCHRSELYYRARSVDDDDRAEARWRSPLDGVEVTPARFAGRVAAQHLFRVAAGLESLVLGETEVLGQLRGALEAATAAGSAGPLP